MCDFKSKSAGALVKHTKTEQKNTNLKKVIEKKFFCHECDMSFETRRVSRNMKKSL